MRKLKNLRKKSLDELLETMPTISDLQLGKFVGGGGQDSCYYCNPNNAHGYYWDPGGYNRGSYFNGSGCYPYSSYCGPGSYSCGPDSFYNGRPAMVDFESKKVISIILEWFNRVNRGPEYSVHLDEMISPYSKPDQLGFNSFFMINEKIKYSIGGVSVQLMYQEENIHDKYRGLITDIRVEEVGGLIQIRGRNHGTTDVIRITLGSDEKSKALLDRMYDAMGYK